LSKKVWLVTTGEYSDYHVVVAFTTRQLARAFVADHNAKRREHRDAGSHDPYYSPSYEVEEMPLLDALPGPAQVQYHAYAQVQDGRVTHQGEYTRSYPMWEPVQLEETVRIRTLDRPRYTPAREFTIGDRGEIIGHHTVSEELPPSKMIEIVIEGPDREHVMALLRAKVAEVLGEPTPG
jgi:hypothetical protein